MGLVGLAVGALPFLTLMGVLPAGRSSPDEAPQWIGILFGLMFFFAGITTIIRSFTGGDANGDLPATAPPVLRIANYALGIVIVAGLATLLSWVAFGPGERHFIVSAGVFTGGTGAGFTERTGAGGDLLGRIAFGFGAVLGWFMLGMMVVLMMRRWRSRQ
ncbi:MAG TPA: hypothetical protein VHY79_07245 [Rhizomicrobium sp.]|nr:hypothetical protein [Rhizomicrobium sp.]